MRKINEQNERIKRACKSLGRPEPASVGLYHLETWVARSQQEASHSKIDARLAAVRGDKAPLAGIRAKEGEHHGTYAYGARYRRGSDSDKARCSLYDSVKNATFKFTEAGNVRWFFQEGVDLNRLAEVAAGYGDAVQAQQVRGIDGADGADPAISDRSTADLADAADTEGSGIELRRTGRVGGLKRRSFDRPIDRRLPFEKCGGTVDAQTIRGAHFGREIVRGRSVEAVGVDGTEARPVVYISAPKTYRQSISQTTTGLGGVNSKVTVQHDYAGMHLFFMDKVFSGFALNSEVIISTFGDPGALSSGIRTMFPVAVAQSDRCLFPFDTFLPRIYEHAGYRALAKAPFSLEFAPAD